MGDVWRERHLSVHVWKVKRVCVCVCVCVSVNVEERRRCACRGLDWCVCGGAWMVLCVERKKYVCVNRLRFKCGVRDVGMGVCVERQLCVCVCVCVCVFGGRDWALFVFVCTCGETGVCVRVSV